MGRKLTDKTAPDKLQAKRLIKAEVVFKVALEDNIDKKYCFSKLKENHIKTFQRFLDQTVYKQLTISETDNLFLRTKGKKNVCRKLVG